MVDLRHAYNAPVQQFVGKVERFFVNGQLVRTSTPIYAMIDTGTTGLYIVESMFYDLQRQAKGFKSAEVRGHRVRCL